MTDYLKPDIVPAWGETNTTSADMVKPTDPEIQTGWASSPTPPSRQRFNWFQHWVTNAVRYFMQLGLSEYDASEYYRIGSRVIDTSDGKTYRSKADNNQGNTPSTSPTQWERWGYTNGDLVNFGFNSPTAVTQAQSDNSTKVATTAFVTNKVQLNFAISLGASGYIKLPSWLGGFIIQWITASTDSTGSQPVRTLNFPIAFPNACVFCLPSTKIDSTSTYAEVFYQLISFTATQCVVQRQTQEHDDRNSQALVLAIGY